MIDKELNYLIQFESWINRNNYSGFDPYDLWSTKFGLIARKIFYKNRILSVPLITPILIVDTFFPVIRKLFVKPIRYAISDAHFIFSYVNLFRITNDERYLLSAIKLGDELLFSSINGYSGYCWGLPFNWQNNNGLWRKHTPLITVTSYCFDAYFELYEITKMKKYKDILHSISQFVYNDLKITKTSENIEICSYSPFDQTKVINANSYCAFTLIRAFAIFGIAEYKKRATKIINFILQNQNEDGSWFYSVDNHQDKFIDNIHTCFILKTLYKSNQFLKNPEIENAIIKGYFFYRNNFFTKKIVPKPFVYLKRFNPIKIELYDYAEGITLNLLLKDLVEGSEDIADKLVNDIINNYTTKHGFFTSKVNIFGKKLNIPYVRWPQAQLFYALTTHTRLKYLDEFSKSISTLVQF